MSDFMSIGSRTVPENFGPIRGANGNARLTDECGDTMEFWISVEKNTIINAGYMSDGNSSSCMCGSVMAAMIVGSSLETAESISQADILGLAGDIESDSSHCTLLASDALKAAIADYRKQMYLLNRSGEKKSASAKSVLNPKPALLVSCKGTDGRDNVFVVTYAANCSINPPSIMIGIVSTRSSFDLIKSAGCFIANLAPVSMKKAYHYLGTHTELDEEKFKKIGMKTGKGLKVNASILVDCPVNIECTVTGSINTGSHEMFIGKIEYVHADTEVVKADGTIDWSMVALLQ